LNTSIVSRALLVAAMPAAAIMPRTDSCRRGV
jgi:hypothetical protein